MLPEYLPLLIQVPIVGAFIFFVLMITRLYIQNEGERDEQWQTFLQQLSDSECGTINTMREGIGASMREMQLALRDMSRQIAKNTAIILAYESARSGKVHTDTVEIAKEFLRRGHDE